MYHLGTATREAPRKWVKILVADQGLPARHDRGCFLQGRLSAFVEENPESLVVACAPPVIIWKKSQKGILARASV